MASPFSDDGFMEIIDDGHGKSNNNNNKKINNNNYNNIKDNKKDDKTPVGDKYEGYMLERANPRGTGEKLSWSRVGKRALPFSEKKLYEIMRAHRKRSGKTSEEDFAALSSNQRGIIDRLILDRKLNEKNKNADWVLVDVQKDVSWKWRTVDVRKIQVIIKRYDKNQASGTGNHAAGGGKTSYQFGEIIDLSEPPEKKKDHNNNGKDGAKKPRKPNNLDNLDNLDILGDPLGLGGFGPPPREQNHGHGHGPPHGHNQPMHNDLFAGQPMPPPPGPLPGPPPPPMHNLNGFGPNTPIPFGPNHGPGPRMIEHPFQPNPEFAVPDPYESPPMHGQEFPHPHMGGARVRTRSHSQRRKSSTRRPSVDPRVVEEMQDEIEQLKEERYQRNEREARSRMDRFRFGSEGSEESYDEESIFSPPPSDGRSFTPPSSPRSQFSERMARGSLERRHSSRDPRSLPRYRSNGYKYREVEVEPAYTHRNDSRRFSPDRRRHSSRPRLHHSQTHDEYSTGGGQRFLPPAQPRRLTDAAYDDERAEYDQRRRRRRSTTFDPRLQEAFEAGRREATRGGGYYR